MGVTPLKEAIVCERNFSGTNFCKSVTPKHSFVEQMFAHCVRFLYVFFENHRVFYTK